MKDKDYIDEYGEVGDLSDVKLPPQAKGKLEYHSTPNKDKELERQIEELAAIEHERWADWQRWCNGEIRANANDIESPLRRWDKQIETPYEQLSEREKDSDREQVRRYLPIIKDLIAQERRKAKIEVLEKPILLELHIKQSQDYKQGFRDAVEQVESYRKDKLAELKEDKNE